MTKKSKNEKFEKRQQYMKSEKHNTTASLSTLQENLNDDTPLSYSASTKVLENLVRDSFGSRNGTRNSDTSKDTLRGGKEVFSRLEIGKGSRAVIQEPRTEQLMRYLEYAWIIHLILIIGMTYLLTFNVNFAYSTDLYLFSRNTILNLFWILPMPSTVLNFFGLILPFRMDRYKYQRENRKKQRRFDNLYIVIVTRGENREAVLRSWEKHKDLEKIPKTKVHILTDEPYSFEGLNCFACPRSFKCNARYKARALEWYRRIQKFTKYDWVLHLDEESIVDKYTVEKCIDFIKYSPYHYGQGMILYNQYSFWDKWAFTAADMVRVGDDMGKFHLQSDLVHWSFIGIHGSFFLANGKLENHVTWNINSFTEDFYFSILATRYGYKFGSIDGIVREQSPQGFMDFMRQRRRWFAGISQTPLFGAKLWAFLWFAATFSLTITIITSILNYFFPGPIPRGLAFLRNFNTSVYIITVCSASPIQSYDAGEGILKGLFHLFIVFISTPIASMMETMAVLYAVILPPKNFDVIKK